MWGKYHPVMLIHSRPNAMLTLLNVDYTKLRSLANPHPPTYTHVGLHLPTHSQILAWSLLLFSHVLSKMFELVWEMSKLENNDTFNI